MQRAVFAALSGVDTDGLSDEDCAALESAFAKLDEAIKDADHGRSVNARTAIEQALDVALGAALLAEERERPLHQKQQLSVQPQRRQR